MRRTAGELLVRTIRAALSPRRVPHRVLLVPAVPLTLSGVKLEVPVKRLLQGAAPAGMVNPATLADPRCLDPHLALDLS